MHDAGDTFGSSEFVFPSDFAPGVVIIQSVEDLLGDLVRLTQLMNVLTLDVVFNVKSGEAFEVVDASAVLSANLDHATSADVSNSVVIDIVLGFHLDVLIDHRAVLEFNLGQHKIEVDHDLVIDVVHFAGLQLNIDVLFALTIVAKIFFHVNVEVLVLDLLVVNLSRISSAGVLLVIGLDKLVFCIELAERGKVHNLVIFEDSYSKLDVVNAEHIHVTVFLRNLKSQRAGDPLVTRDIFASSIYVVLCIGRIDIVGRYLFA